MFLSKDNINWFSSNSLQIRWRNRSSTKKKKKRAKPFSSLPRVSLGKILRCLSEINWIQRDSIIHSKEWFAFQKRFTSARKGSFVTDQWTIEEEQSSNGMTLSFFSLTTNRCNSLRLLWKGWTEDKEESKWPWTIRWLWNCEMREKVNTLLLCFLHFSLSLSLSLSLSIIIKRRKCCWTLSHR